MTETAGPLRGRVAIVTGGVPGVRTSFLQGIGGMFGAAGSLVLSTS